MLLLLAGSLGVEAHRQGQWESALRDWQILDLVGREGVAVLSVDMFVRLATLEEENVELRDDIRVLRKALKDVEVRIPVPHDPFNGGAAYTQMQRICWRALEKTK